MVRSPARKPTASAASSPASPASTASSTGWRGQAQLAQRLGLREQAAAAQILRHERAFIGQHGAALLQRALRGERLRFRFEAREPRFESRAFGGAARRLGGELLAQQRFLPVQRVAQRGIQRAAANQRLRKIQREQRVARLNHLAMRDMPRGEQAGARRRHPHRAGGRRQRAQGGLAARIARGRGEEDGGKHRAGEQQGGDGPAQRAKSDRTALRTGIGGDDAEQGKVVGAHRGLVVSGVADTLPW
jgi:hypothetical protein